MIIRCRWHGDTFEPISADQAACNEHFVIGMTYQLEPIFPRDRNLTAARFAALNEAYKQLPHEYKFANFDHFRKWLLVREGYCTVREMAYADDEEARRAEAFLKGVCQDNPRDKDYAIVVRAGAVIRIFEPASMSEKSMKPGEFRECTSKLLEAAASMIGVTVEELRSNAGRAA